MDDTTQAQPRRSHLTPGRCLLTLLAVEFLLFLSQWLRWLPKGWPVLIAVAAVGMVVLGMFVWLGVALVFRRRFQFSLRSLLVLVVVVAVPCSWFSAEMKRAKRQQEAAAAIFEAGGLVFYDIQFVGSGINKPKPAWLLELMGGDFFWQCDSVDLSRGNVTDVVLRHVEVLTRVECLSLGHTALTDGGLRHLEGLVHLRSLDLGETEVTPAGVAKLQQALPNCKITR